MKDVIPVQLAILTFAGWLFGCLPATDARAVPADSPGTSGTRKAEAHDAADIREGAGREAEPEARAWLGVAVEETSEALSEQLGLSPGVGLVVLHVSPDSPAAKAGLKRNDVLAALAGHPLSHPAQLRRLVQARAPGDAVELVFYRGGKRQTVEVTLGKAPLSIDWPGAPAGPSPSRALRWGDAWDDLLKQLREQWKRFSTEPGDRLQQEIERSLEQARQALEEATRRISQAQPRIQADIERSLEQARKAVEDAIRQMTNAWGSLRLPGGPLQDLLRGGVRVDKNAEVSVRTKADSSYTLVKSGDWGTIILTGPPARLTARDKHGTLVFEGEIETPEQRAQVPPEVWQRVAPLLDEMPSTPAPSKSKPRPTRQLPQSGVVL